MLILFQQQQFNTKQGNLQDGAELATKMPALMKLKKAIYSPEYRAFVERITGLDPGTLTDEVRRGNAVNLHFAYELNN